MKIKELRAATKLSQQQFAGYFGIPVGTLRNWEQGIANPPDYVFQMIFATIRRDKMINVETIKFVNMLNQMAELTKNPILPFDEANEQNADDNIFYDLESKDEDGGYMVVCDKCIVDDPQCYHHDIISYCGSDNLEYRVRVRIYDDDPPYIEIKLLLSEEFLVVENGGWYFA